MFILIGFLTMIPLCFIIIFVIIGFNASILRHMDGIEPAISINTFFEPCKRWISLALPIFVVYLVLWIVSFIFQIFSIIPYLGLLIYPIASIFLTMLQTAYIMYWADNREGTIEEHLARPFKLLFRHVMCWVSAMLTGLLGCIPLILLSIVYIVIILMIFPDVELDEPDTFKTGASITFSVVMFSIMFFALMAGFIFSAFLYAIAYKQSHAREQLMRPCFPPPPAVPPIPATRATV